MNALPKGKSAFNALDVSRPICQPYLRAFTNVFTVYLASDLPRVHKFCALFLATV